MSSLFTCQNSTPSKHLMFRSLQIDHITHWRAIYHFFLISFLNAPHSNKPKAPLLRHNQVDTEEGKQCIPQGSSPNTVHEKEFYCLFIHLHMLHLLTSTLFSSEIYMRNAPLAAIKTKKLVFAGASPKCFAKGKTLIWNQYASDKKTTKNRPSTDLFHFTVPCYPHVIITLSRMPKKTVKLLVLEWSAKAWIPGTTAFLKIQKSNHIITFIDSNPKHQETIHALVYTYTCSAIPIGSR